jgi:hypothetical protein
MTSATYEEAYEDYVCDCLRDRFHEDHPRKAIGLLNELAKYRDPILAAKRMAQRNGNPSRQRRTVKGAGIGIFINRTLLG